jgi:molybdopterin-biosynthesis enzyme MoeA-like protein
MARIPCGGRLVATREMPWPTIVMHNVWILPGVPEIFAMKMPVVASELGGGPAFVSAQLYTTLDEGVLKSMLDQVVAAYADVELGSYPKWRHPRYRTKLTFDGLDEVRVMAARDALLALLPEGALVDVDDE